jgi:NAD(P)-dependent dehydrogenase (short-subunit alcohol dehydrogenase family)
LEDKVALITGPATGIGNAVARLFAEHGASLLLIDRNQPPNEKTAAELERAGAKVRVVGLDLRNRTGIDAAVADALESFGSIDILVNKAGIYPRKAFLETSGKIVNISSVTFHRESLIWFTTLLPRAV